MSLKSHYRFIVVESVADSSESKPAGHVQVRTRAGQVFPSHWHIACPRRFLGSMVPGACFRLKLKLAHRSDGSPFLFADPSTPPQKVGVEKPRQDC